jgi:prepilin-type N-terminal cleavage/methylation domain-containing protein
MSQVKLRGPQVKSIASRRGFTLIEVLVATVVTLLMMVSLAQVFKLMGDSMKQGRAALELNSRLRNVAYRIQLDLNNCTVTPKPGSEAVSGAGYFKAYDGPLTDYSYGMISAAFNRFGDVDDILMFTARAGDDWFVGKVPLFVLQGLAPTNQASLELVTITAQHAEIAVFVEPMVTNESNPNRDPYYLRMNPAGNFDRIVDSASGSILPASYRLHYRTLLIRPDLNLAASGALPFGTVGGSDWLVAQATSAQFPAGTGPVVSLPSPTCDMVGPHQQCDLSIRRVDPYATSPVAANSLEDLANPANRFAHVQIPIVPNSSSPPLTDFSMPIMALSPKLNSTYTLSEPGTLLTAASTLPLDHQSAFIHPAFILTGDRTGEDVLASDVLAFDVKGFDPTVPLYEVAGTVVSPNDPGYSTSGTLVGNGEFVDIGWGRKAQIHFGSGGISQLSGVASNSAIPFTDSLYRSGLAVQSGGLPVTPYGFSTNLLIFQPSYDSWYSKYEGDGFLQAEIGGPTVRGVLQLRGTSTPKDAWRTVADAGTDGIDNSGSGSGVDDLTELETSAPFPMDLRGVKVTIRMEDSSARTFNQMSVTKEFVTQ